MELTAKALADRIGGTIEGPTDLTLNRVAKIEDAGKGSLTFLANKEYEGFIYTTGASAALVAEDFTPTQDLPQHLAIIRVRDPYTAFAGSCNGPPLPKPIPQALLRTHTSTPQQKWTTRATSGLSPLLRPARKLKLVAKSTAMQALDVESTSAREPPFTGRSPFLTIAPSAAIASSAGAVIGSDGFGFAPNNTGQYDKVPQTGNVTIGNGCEIGAATTIDRATLGSTVIEDGVKLDNQIQIAHNVKLAPTRSLPHRLALPEAQPSEQTAWWVGKSDLPVTSPSQTVSKSPLNRAFPGALPSQIAFGRGRLHSQSRLTNLSKSRCGN